ncbi:MAG: deoxyguanosinetriphosphate triphosphohydrolase [Clostridia bacterium]|nr:deoxyguanosinetriphosphate triphosphohydrolase [Clostridia bacterium]
MKQHTYDKEKMFLSPYAKPSIETAGRKREEAPCPMRTDFQRDRDRIIHSKAFRRLKNKTQVFILPKGDHYRTRMTHTLDVTQIARSITRALLLNEDLAEAIALGHDLGHTPFGHIGERKLAELTDGYFKHNEQSVRVCEFLENDGRGLNLTAEVLDGILNHGSNSNPSTLEGRAVMFADKIAYINHDIDDSFRAGLLSPNDLPKDAVNALGDTATKRINNMIMGIVEESFGKPTLTMRADLFEAMKEMRSFMFAHVYTVNAGNREAEKADRLIEYLFEYFKHNPQEMPKSFSSRIESENANVILCDYIASMSDSYAIGLFKQLTVPDSVALP